MIKEELRKEIERLKAENARLAAALAMCKLIADTHKPHAEGCDCLRCVPFERMHDHASEPSSALCDLLAPTIEVLRQATLRPITWQDDVKKELYRLSTLIKT